MSSYLTREIRIVIADDHQMMIDGLRSLLQEEENIIISGEANNGNEVLQLLEQESIDVVLADINMPVMNGIELTKEIKRTHPEVEVLALTMHQDSDSVSAMLDAGASGYILKSTGIRELVKAIEQVASRNTYVSRELEQEIVKQAFKKSRSGTAAKEIQLTPREHEILQLVAKEYTNAQIADQLCISERTVETHRKNIFTKTGTKTIIGLITYAIKNKLIPTE